MREFFNLLKFYVMYKKYFSIPLYLIIFNASGESF